MTTIKVFRNGALQTVLFRNNLSLPDAAVADSIIVGLENLTEFYVQNNTIYVDSPDELEANFQNSGISWNPRYVLSKTSNSGKLDMIIDVINSGPEINAKAGVVNAKLPEYRQKYSNRNFAMLADYSSDDIDDILADNQFTADLGDVKLQSKSKNTFPMTTSNITLSEFYEVVLNTGNWEPATLKYTIPPLEYPSGPISIFQHNIPVSIGFLDANHSEIIVSKNEFLQIFSSITSSDYISTVKGTKTGERTSYLTIKVNSRLSNTNIPLTVKLRLNYREMISTGGGKIVDDYWVYTFRNSKSTSLNIILKYSIPLSSS